MRLGEVINQDMIAIVVSGEQHKAAVVAPAYLGRFGEPPHPSELAADRPGALWPIGMCFDHRVTTMPRQDDHSHVRIAGAARRPPLAQVEFAIDPRDGRGNRKRWECRAS